MFIKALGKVKDKVAVKVLGLVYANGRVLKLGTRMLFGYIVFLNLML